MWENLNHLTLPVGNLVLRATLVYLSVLVLLRISGKKQMGQMSATEFVAILLISNAVQNSMNGGDNSLTGGLVIAVVLLSLSTGISYLAFRSPFISMLFEGSPVLLVHRGKMIRKHMLKERVSPQELKVLLRKQGFHQLAEIETAILEADGTLSVTKLNEEPLQHLEI